MSILIFSLLIAAALISRSLSLLVSGAIFASLSMLHFMVFGTFDGENYSYYYAGAAVFDLVSVICICMARDTLGGDWHLKPLAIVITLSIVNNLLGLFVWFFELDSQVYTVAGLVVYMLAIFILAGSRFNVGGILGADRISSIHIVPSRYRCLLGGQERVRCLRES